MDRREMPPDRANRIADAVESIERDVSRLREIRAASLEEYTAEGNQDLRDAVERKFEKLAEATIDASAQVVKQEGRTVPGSRKETITVIEDLGIVDPGLADRLREAIGFRDVLAHTYGPIVNDDLVRDALEHGIDRYVAFVEAVSEYMAQFED